MDENRRELTAMEHELLRKNDIDSWAFENALNAGATFAEWDVAESIHSGLFRIGKWYLLEIAAEFWPLP